MTQEEKAKAYDEALRRAKDFYSRFEGMNAGNVLEDVFPELKESEDDKIRKNCIHFLEFQKRYHAATFEIDKCIAWLEKQKSHYIFEPKFKIGDWIIVHNKDTYQVIEVNLHNYKLKHYLGGEMPFPYTQESSLRLWTIQDAKDGDVLVNQNGEMPFIFKECKNNHIYCYCGYTNRKDIFFDRFVDSEGEELHWLNLYHEQLYPATKEQCDFLFQKMKEAGYEWNTEKKELKKL